MVGLPSTRVIPTGWAEHHRPTVRSTMTTPCTIGRITGGPAPYPKPPGWTGEALLHTTVCRVQQLNREDNGIPAEQPTQQRTYRVSLPVDGTPELQAGERGDIIHALGRQLRIQQVLFGTNEFERDVLCTDNLTQQNPA